MLDDITFKDRFWSKVDTAGVCWEWLATLDKHGYGRFRVGGRAGRPVAAHRVAWEMLVGPVPEGMELDHLCRNHPCVNPDHMEPVTHHVNTLRGYGATAQHARKTHCKHGHEFTPENTYRHGPDNRHRMCRECNRIRARKNHARGKSTQEEKKDIMIKEDRNSSQYQKLPHTDGRCGARWGKQTEAHCYTCHETLNGVEEWDAHMPKGICQGPASAGLVLVAHRRYRVWGFPAPDELPLMWR